ncbi:MAG: FKBP-type peptidyl-prolyl cis-trans isomerase [Flavobacteriaceae bacterium]
MFNRKLLFLFLSILFIGYACNDDNFGVQVDDFDYEGQALVDNDSILVFLENHYYNDAIDSVQPLVTGATSLLNDSRLIIQDVTDFNVDYKLYVFVKSVGNPVPDKGYPTEVDSVLVKYKGQYFNSTVELIDFDERTVNPLWLTLNSVIRGWSHGFTNFKGGENITNNGPITYANGGKGVLFIPSGLAYGQFGTAGIPPSSSLMFYIELYDLVENTDHDLDSVPSILEDPDGDGDPRNDDTDGDGFPNFSDPDDDNDGVLTKDEGGADGDPTNDFNDPNNPTLPDYLNPDIN